VIFKKFYGQDSTVNHHQLSVIGMCALTCELKSEWAWVAWVNMSEWASMKSVVMCAGSRETEGRECTTGTREPAAESGPGKPFSATVNCTPQFTVVVNCGVQFTATADAPVQCSAPALYWCWASAPVQWTQTSLCLCSLYWCWCSSLCFHVRIINPCCVTAATK